MENMYGANRSRAGEGWGAWGIIPGSWCLGNKEAGEAFLVGCVGEVRHRGVEVSTQGGGARLAPDGAAPAPAPAPGVQHHQTRP